MTLFKICGGFPFVAGLLIIGPPVRAQQPLPLPTKTDIPSDYSTVICPTRDAAQAMLGNHYVPDKNWFDGPIFFSGLKATGCNQESGPLRIVSVLGRKSIQAGPSGIYLFYQAVRPNGETVYGVVHESGNNNHPRTPFERWLQTYAPGGMLKILAAEKRAYICKNPAVAMKFVSSIPTATLKGVTKAKQLQAKAIALKSNGCAYASGNYHVTAVHNETYINLGFEASEVWTAITARDARGQVVGLVYDTDVYR